MKLKKQGFIQASGIALYCLLIGLFFGQGNKFLPKLNPIFGPILFLLLFTASALICALIVFYKPYKLFFDGKKKEAADIVISTAISLFIFVLLTFALLLLVR